MSEWKDKIEGKAKETVGSVTGDQSQETEGKAQNTWGQAQGTLNKAKDTVSSAVDDADDGDGSDSPA